MNEHEAELLLVRLLETSGWSVARQVALGHKRVDIIAMLDETWAIEVKLNRWRRAAHQAFLNSGYVHRSYVAVPRGPRHQFDTHFLSELGVGMIEFDDSSYECVWPARYRTLDYLGGTIRGR